MSNEWKIGDWVTVDGWRNLVYRVYEDRLCVVDDDGDDMHVPFCIRDFAKVVKRLPDCTGWDWIEPKPNPLQYSFDGLVWVDAKATGVVDAATEGLRMVFIDDDHDETFAVRVRNGVNEWPITVKRTQRYEVVSSRADIKAEAAS